MSNSDFDRLLGSVNNGNVKEAQNICGSNPELVNARFSPSGGTLLQAAVRNGDVDMILALAELGADVNLRNYLGTLPVAIAAFSNKSVPLTRLLLDLGADPNQYANDQFLIHPASFYEDMCCVFLEYGAKPNVFDFADRTPLHIAASSNLRKVVMMLLRHGADPHLKANAQSNSALEEAIKYNKHDIVADINAWCAAKKAHDTVAETVLSGQFQGLRSLGFRKNLP